MNRSEVSQIDISTGAGQERTLLIMKEMLEECSRLQSKNSELRSAVSDAESKVSEAQSIISETEKLISKLSEENLKLQELMQSAVATISRLSSLNEELWVSLEEKTDGIGEILADSEEEIVGEIKARQAWIKKALELAGNGHGPT